MPLLLSPWHLIELSYALVYAIACLGLNLLFGTTGLLSLGHAAYFGIGAYAGGFLHYFGPLTSLEAYLLAGVVGSTALAAVLGFLCVRAVRIQFTILTLALAQIVYSLFITGAAFRLFGGLGKGLYFLYEGGLYIPRFTILGTVFPPEEFIPVLYHVILVAFLLSTWTLWRISRSPFGVALRAIRDNETRAALIGLRLRRYRWCAFLISGAFVGLAGGLWGQLDRQITPEQLNWLFSARLVLATVLGGTRHFVGPILGAFAFVILHDIALRWTGHREVVLGLLLIAVVFAFPGGIAGSAAGLLARTRGGSR
ncbi:MAG: branched-chain amino acid ABC transporter permease [Candidatus Rokubacteria bacterium]|nr:branched-chain amino acid ABC transporter permease [Candidatus Rokubacteria bacterium]